ncbi:MAG TPA: translational machinery protein [Bauldia sp.]|nr:translational machinery protein [Bauldia sp.]
MPTVHAAVWIDHEQAKVFVLTRESDKEWKVRPHDRHVHIHTKAGKGDSGHVHDESYFHGVADAIKDAAEILIAGPGTAKSELLHHLQHHDPQVAKKVVAVEALDHPTDNQLVAIARKFFKGADQLRGSAPLPGG